MNADLEDLKRDELDELASDAGVPDPEKLPNKKAVIEALSEPNPALIPEPEERVEQTYTNVGPHIVLGHAPGETFTALIPESQEALLIESGALATASADQPIENKE